MGQFRADLAYEPGPIISSPRTRQTVEFCTGAPRLRARNASKRYKTGQQHPNDDEKGIHRAKDMPEQLPEGPCFSLDGLKTIWHASLVERFRKQPLRRYLASGCVAMWTHVDTHVATR